MESSFITSMPLNGHAIGIVMKELVYRAIRTIRSERFIFETHSKVGYTGKLDDFVTTADKAAQQVYLKSLRECFPTFGVVAEEDHLKLDCTDPGGHDLYFTVDPLDGTKAFIRRQSHGVGTMISLVRSGEIIAAYVGDINTGEIYGYRPDSSKAHRITTYENTELLKIDESRPLTDQYLLLRDPPEAHSEFINKSTRHLNDGGLFRNLEVSGGSIGIWMARLWKGEVGAAALPGNKMETPWDLCPVLGISQKLGFVFLETSRGCRETVLAVPKDIFRRDEELLVVHRSRVPEVREYWKRVNSI